MSCICCLSGVPVTGHAGLHFARRIAAHGDAALGRGQQNHAADFGEFERRFHVEGGEYRFDRDAVRLEFLDQIAQHRVDFAEPLGKMFRSLARGAQRAETQHPAAAPVAFDHAVAGGSGSGGIDAQHTEEIAVHLRRLRHGTECTAAHRARPQFFRHLVRRSLKTAWR